MKNPFLLILYCFVFCISCRHNKDTETRKVFRYNEYQGISTLDPAYAKSLFIIKAVNQLYNGLLQLDDSMRVKPCIAKSWKISDQGKKYTFILRNDVYFHDHLSFPVAMAGGLLLPISFTVSAGLWIRKQLHPAPGYSMRLIKRLKVPGMASGQ